MGYRQGPQYDRKCSFQLNYFFRTTPVNRDLRQKAVYFPAQTLVTVGLSISVQCHLNSSGVRLLVSRRGPHAHSLVPWIFFLNFCVLCKFCGEHFGIVNC